MLLGKLCTHRGRIDGFGGVVDRCNVVVERGWACYWRGTTTEERRSKKRGTSLVALKMKMIADLPRTPELSLQSSTLLEIVSTNFENRPHILGTSSGDLYEMCTKTETLLLSHCSRVRAMCRLLSPRCLVPPRR